MSWSKEEFAEIVAGDLENGWYVNLGIGLPMGVIGRIPDDREVVVQSENGILGMAPPARDPDPDLVDAGKRPVGVAPGCAFFDTVTSFTMIRGGRIDVAVMGAYEVTPTGDIANWRNDSERVSGRIESIDGATDIAVGVRRLWVMMRHFTEDGRAKVVTECSLPLTACGTVKRIYTDRAVFEVTAGPLLVRRLAPGVSPADQAGSTEVELDLSALCSPEPTEGPGA